MKKIILIGAVLALTGAGYATFTTIQHTDITPYHPEDPRSGGAAAILGQDRTGGPLSVGTCSACHLPTGSTTSISGVLKDEFSTVTTSYDTGEDYTMEFTVANNLFNNFGFQANALTSSNAQGGDFTSVISSNTQISSIGGIEYPEHQGAKAGVGSTTFIVNWVAPVNGTGTIDVFGIGMGVNLNASTTGDAPGAGGGLGAMFSLTENPPTLISYSMPTYCTSDGPDIASIAGNFTGNFSSSPAGLAINVSTGEITPSLSTPGFYNVDYIYGSGAGAITSTTVEIFGSDPSFVYTSNSYCQNDSDPTANITGDTGGTFSAPSEVVFANSTTGEIDLGSSTAGGPYTITYTLSSPCAATSTFDVSITTADDPTFSYATSYCQTDADPSAGSVATPGGVFSGPGQVIFTNTNTGEIDLSASTAGGPYTVIYTTGGVCSNMTSQDINIGEEYFESASASICEDGTFQFGTLTLDSSNVGLISQTFNSIFGCDSNVNLTLTVITIDSTISSTATTLTSNDASASYQWVDCDDINAPIIGETSQTFTPLTSGNYAVEITIGSCTEISECVEMTIEGSSLNENEISLVKLYPNPASNKIQLEGLEKLIDVSSISIMDINGKVIEKLTFDQNSFDISQIADGIYQVIIIHENGIENLRLIKE